MVATAVVPIATWTFCPVGTKLSITNNILTIQEPSWSQSISRSYNKDGRDDLVYLFNVIVRFNKFYIANNKDNCKNSSLFKILIARVDISDKLPIGVATIYRTPFSGSSFLWDNK